MKRWRIYTQCSDGSWMAVAETDSVVEATRWIPPVGIYKIVDMMGEVAPMYVA